MSMAEVLKPELLRLGNFCYRVNPGDAKNQVAFSASQDALEIYTEEYDQNEDVDERIKETSGGTYTVSLDIPSALFKFIIGKKGETKRKIEYETKCEVVIPARGREGCVVIRGSTGRQVSSALTRIEVLTESGRVKVPFTHFISIPINQPIVQEGFTEFQQDVLDNFSKCRGIGQSLFQNPSKLHLTVGTMTLLNDSEVTKATKILHDCKDELINILGENHRLRVQGLDYMNDDPSAVDILYAKVMSADNSDKLAIAVDKIVTSFSQAGILNKDFDRGKVKLHLTLMNTLFRKDSTGASQSEKTPARGRETFDAKAILKEMIKFDFGEVAFPGFHLSKRYSTSCEGYYEAVTEICSPSTATSVSGVTKT